LVRELFPHGAVFQPESMPSSVSGALESVGCNLSWLPANLVPLNFATSGETGVELRAGIRVIQVYVREMATYGDRTMYQ